MAASISVRVQTGPGGGSESAAVAGFDMISADNALNTLANRQANPIAIPSAAPTSAYSFEKWIKFAVDVAPANSVTNFRAWSPGGGALGAGAGVTVNAQGQVAVYTTPVSIKRGTASPIPATQGAGLQVDAGSYNTIGQRTQYLVLQLEVGAAAAQGNIAQVAVNFSYDES